jgi:hypothetical protein
LDGHLLTVLSQKPLAKGVVIFFEFLLMVFINKPLAKVFYYFFIFANGFC